MIAETFIPGEGFVYRLDPRPKILVLISLTILMIIENNILLQVCFLIFILSITLLTLGKRRVFIPIKSIMPVLILTAVLTPLFHKEGQVLLSAGSFIFLTVSGLKITLLLLIRFTGITTAFFLFFASTRISDFILALRSLGLPYRASLTITISLRYIPDMFVIYNRITDAHKLRSAGLDIDRRRGFIRRIKRMYPVLISVLIHAVKSIPGLAMALDSKGFGRSNRRTSCSSLVTWKAISSQIIFSVLLIAIFVGAVFIC